jgi:hypothetical protein
LGGTGLHLETEPGPSVFSLVEDLCDPVAGDSRGRRRSRWDTRTGQAFGDIRANRRPQPDSGQVRRPAARPGRAPCARSAHRRPAGRGGEPVTTVPRNTDRLTFLQLLDRVLASDERTGRAGAGPDRFAFRRRPALVSRCSRSASVRPGSSASRPVSLPCRVRRPGASPPWCGVSGGRRRLPKGAAALPPTPTPGSCPAPATRRTNRPQRTKARPAANPTSWPAPAARGHRRPA